MRRSLLSTFLTLPALLLGVAGCDDGYSSQVVYEVRTDPLKTKETRTIEPATPDRPGQLPLMKISDLDNPLNPFYEENRKLNFITSELFRDPTMASEQDRARIQDVLDELFGTPAKPTVGDPDFADLSKHDRDLLKLSDEILARGSKLYRIHCLHCHGVTGDGRGPTARWVNPHPRDYRQGQFKFQSVDLSKALTPTRADLMRTLEFGIEGTAMPAFTLLQNDEREALVSYVIHLSIRGKTEYNLFLKSFAFRKNKKKLEYEDPEQGSIKKSAKSWFLSNVKEWVVSQAPSSQIEIGEYPSRLSDPKAFEYSVKRGWQLFTDPGKLDGKTKVKDLPAEWSQPPRTAITTACVSCHIDYGRRSLFKLDDWGTFAKPNNLTLGVYRGGRRPIDIYRRIHSGIAPSGMIAFSKFLDSEDVWNLVNFVQVLGNPPMRQRYGIYLD